MKAVQSSSHVSEFRRLMFVLAIVFASSSEDGRKRLSLGRTVLLGISVFKHIANSEEFMNVFMRIGFILPSNWFPLTRVKWLPLMANSLRWFSGIVNHRKPGGQMRHDGRWSPHGFRSSIVVVLLMEYQKRVTEVMNV
ncbi:hypothetical protein Tco_1003665 [Tanacetum coccineum]|uniref:Uncharacterized protein n=1 Tax=Tanacetum coccineum TaxID=301880 RepID=A0ABQ5FBK9_9ASTR